MIDKIYDAVDDFGLITSEEAKGLGVSNAELVQQARRGKLVRVARGVYRMPVWPQQEGFPYAVAVKAAGGSARLSGESVVALLGLAPTRPSVITVSSPKRVRRSLGDGIVVSMCREDAPTAFYDGIPSQPAYEAIKDAAPAIGPSRAKDAAEAALRQGYISRLEAKSLIEEIGS